MKALKRIFQKIDRAAKQDVTKRSFEGARFTRLEADWLVGQTSLDADMRWTLKTLINRSRSLEQNNEYAAGFLRLMENNVLGASPFVLQMKILEENGSHDKVAERLIERRWIDWGKPQHCTVMGNLSLCDVYRILLRSVLRDGALLLRKHTSMSRANKYALKLEPLDIDYLDPDYNDELPNGHRIIMSVEIDEMRRPVAYWLLGSHPGDVLYTGKNIKRTRVPASEVIHAYFQTRANQTRGYPVFAPILLTQKNVAGYKEAEIVAARAAAAKMGFFERSPGENAGYGGGDDPFFMEAAAGTIEELPAGLTFKQWDPQHPTSQFGDFVKECLRGMASALGVSYMTFANDAGDASYSSARIGMLEEREGYKVLQRWMIEHVCVPIFESWLMSNLAKLNTQPLLQLPATRFEKFNQPHFQGRRWQWVDPEKEAKGLREAIDAGLTSPARVIAELGADEEEILDEIRQTKDERAMLGLVTTEKQTAIQKAMSEAGKDAPLFASLGAVGMQALTQVLQQVASGQISAQAAEKLFTEVFGLSIQTAKALSEKS